MTSDSPTDIIQQEIVELERQWYWAVQEHDTTQISLLLANSFFLGISATASPLLASP